MSRLEKFETLKSHAWYKKLFAKLSKSNIDFCVEFLKETKDLDATQYAFKVNRLTLGKRFDKKSDKNRMLICQELLDTSNIR